MDAAEETLTYVYAVAPVTEHLEDAPAGLRGIYGSPVLFLTAPPPAGPGDPPAPLAFAAGHVPRRDFDESALKNHFEDLEWLEGVARAHHDVVQALSVHATVLPLRMATVYQDDERARQALSEQYRTFAERLERLSGHTEFGVKLYLAPTPEPAAAEADADAGADTATSPGKAYLRRRRAQHNAVEVMYGQARTAAALVEAVALDYASQRVRHPTQSGELAGSAQNVLNDAYLVPDACAGQFKAAVEDAVSTFGDVRVEVTGPWAPYSFAMPPVERGDPPPAEDEGRGEDEPERDAEGGEHGP